MQFSTLLAGARLGPAVRADRSGGGRADEASPSGIAGVRRLTGQADVHRVVTDSRRARQGDCFVAVRGTAADGHQFIRAAVQAGASAVVCEDPSPVPDGVPCAVVEDTRQAAARLAQAILDWPSRKLTCVGVTGTNGKTTLTYLLRRVLQDAGGKVALLGTIAYETLDRSVQAGTTTPDPVELAEMTAGAVAAGATHLVMEVSSHALDQRRVAGMDFRVGVFTNLSGDHLDYHGTMENYLAAKRRLFESLAADAFAVLNRDDPAGDALAEATRAQVVWYGLSGAADVVGRMERINPSGSRFALCHRGREWPVRTPLLGRHNVSNCLAAAAAGICLGVPEHVVAAGLAQVTSVPGRLQRVPSEAPFEVLVDYAHTDDALANVLSALRPLARARLIVVFGCGGDRDRTKRPRMARVAEQWADVIIVTSDNPRSERPGAIIEHILAGFTPAGRSKVLVQEDRRSAIEAAIGLAGAGDIVLVAGKGHENYQILGPRRIHFDDVETAHDILTRSG